MKIEVDLSKKFVLTGVIISLIIFGLVGVIAYGTNNPSSFGHSPGEIDWSQIINNITTNKFCLNTTSGMSCVTNWTSGSTTVISSTGKVEIVSRYYKAVASGHGVGQGNPRCPCDISSDFNAAECNNFETNDSVGSLCYDWYKSGGGWNTFYDAVRFQAVEEKYLFQTGGLGIGVASKDPNYRLDVLGGIKITSDDIGIRLSKTGNYGDGIYSQISGNPSGNQGNAIYGYASNPGAWSVNGVKGRTEGNGYGVRGETGPNGLAGIYGITESATGYAGYFEGKVGITGDLSTAGNSWGACHDVTVSTNNWRECDSGEFVTGIYVPAAGVNGIKFRCCKL